MVRYTLLCFLEIQLKSQRDFIGLVMMDLELF